MGISIILTCYKQELFIEETILSVINQTYNDWELLIGDDSPDDRCWNIIQKYAKKYPDKIYARHHSQNRGIVNNMLFLLGKKNKELEYIVFLEGDDCLFPEYLDKKLEIFYKYHDVQLVYNELNKINKESKIIEEKVLSKKAKKFIVDEKITYDELIQNIYYMSWSTLMVRSNMIKKYRIFSEELGSKTILSDVYFFNQIASNELVFGIKQPLVNYRIHEDSVTKNLHGYVLFNLEFIKYIEYLLNLQLINRNIGKREICNRCWRIIIILLKKCFNSHPTHTIKLLFLAFFKSFKYRITRLFNKF